MLGGIGSALKWLALLPVLIAAILFALANNHRITVHLNPFDATDKVLTASFPLYQIAFALFLAGALCGAFVVWNKQRRYRREARRRRADTDRASGRPVRGAGLLHESGA